MAIIDARTEHGTTPRPAGRDSGIDLFRAFCVVIVVLLHATMVGVTVDSSGAVFENAADGSTWFAPLTWFAQIMPIFFVIGGFAGSLAYRRLREKGGSAARFVTGRVHRLLVPAAITIAAVGMALALLAAAGVDAEIVQIAGFRYSQPLWFLGVFLLCQALLPALMAAHDRAPLRTIAALAGGAVVVDVVRTASGIEAIGFLNLALVWLALQQVGFFLADGRIDALRQRTRVLVAVGAVLALAALFLGGVFSPDLYENLNPPTTALLLVGTAQTAVLSLLRAPLASLSMRPRFAAFTAFVTTRTMTIYLWHMPVLLAMAGVSAAFSMTTGIALPEPSSTLWWLTRPLWFAATVVLTAIVAWALSGAERVRMPAMTESRSRVTQSVIAGLLGVVLLLAVGTTPITAAIATALLVFAQLRSREKLALPSLAVRRSGARVVR